MRKPDETLLDWTLRWLEDREQYPEPGDEHGAYEIPEFNPRKDNSNGNNLRQESTETRRQSLRNQESLETLQSLSADQGKGSAAQGISKNSPKVTVRLITDPTERKQFEGEFPEEFML